MRAGDYQSERRGVLSRRPWNASLNRNLCIPCTRGHRWWNKCCDDASRGGESREYLCVKETGSRNVEVRPPEALRSKIESRGFLIKEKRSSGPDPSPSSSAGEPDQADPHQVQPGGVHQVPGPDRRVHPVHRGRAAGVHRGLLPPPPLAPQAEGEAHQPGDGHGRRRHRHLPGRRCYCNAGRGRGSRCEMLLLS